MDRRQPGLGRGRFHHVGWASGFPEPVDAQIASARVRLIGVKLLLSVACEAMG
jgi:hypothetical protein